MNNPLSFYTSQSEKFQESLKKVKQQLFLSAMLRLVVFFILCFGVYFFLENTKAVIGIILSGIVLFVFLVSRHSDLNFKKHFFRELIAINQKEIKALQRKTEDFPEGSEFKNAAHEYSQDIDLFGRGSFFQYINRTATREGTKILAQKLTENDTKSILQKQEAVRELAQKAEWRQEFSGYASVSGSKNKNETSTQNVVDLLTLHSFFVPKAMRFLPTLFSLLSVMMFVLYFLSVISIMQVFLWFFIGLAIVGIYLKKVNNLSSKLSKIQEVFYRHERLITLLEQTNFSSEIMKSIRQKIVLENKNASAIVRQFARNLDALDQRNNMIFGVLANGFLLWDLRQSYRIEKWIASYSLKVKDWFDAIAETDAQNSLANFTFNHPHYTFPALSNHQMIITAKNFVHPLLDPSKAVTNDFRIDKEQFFIITGANMAGKSTFLRTVSLGIVMANAGLPVCAARFIYSPIKLITSMRTSDSLSDDESYFFSELKRLKFIVDKIQNDNYFIILDEILKGTNSTDKALGSRKFVEKLVASHSTGIIATHDLSLCETAQELEDVKNYYFDAEIINDELHFDYTIKNGIAQNMNASFLLRKMKIVD